MQNNTGKAIKWWMERNGCTNYKLAARLCMHRSGVTALLKDDSNPTQYTLKRVARALGIKVSDIVLREEIITERGLEDEN